MDKNVKKKRQRMPVEQRAKQFAPFKSVGGLDEALRKKEMEHQQRQTIEYVTDADINVLSDAEKNDILTI